ncbi:MAG: hypothetical protein ABGX47_23695 [Martelella sp.]|uniref:hypothetical protein n=1 Tax=Martelella sp. TaxID=1969699 RepID=UPI0032423239
MKSLSQFFDHLKLMPIRWDIQRNDELSGTGEGVVYQAELAPPLWKADVTIQPVRLTEAQAISALVRGLGGALEPFMFRDPYICGPRLDPAGIWIVGSTVTIGSVSGGRISLSGLPQILDYQATANALSEWPEDDAGRTAVSVSGVPAGNYQLSAGDKLQVSVSGGRTYFLEVSEDVTASGSSTPLFSVFPRLPASVAAGNAVTLYRPACPCVVVPGSFQAGTVSGNIVSGMGFSIVQKRGV